MAANMGNVEKAAELLKNEDFVRKISKCDDPAAAIALYKENGVDVTAEDLLALGTLLKAMEDNDGEIPDEVAEQVAGGAVSIGKVFEIIGGIGEFFKTIEEPLKKLLGTLGIKM